MTHICDFCSTPRPAFTSVGASIGEIVPGAFDADGRWAACAACAPLIDRRDHPGLVHRALSLLPNARTADAVGRAIIHGNLRHLFRRVLATRSGPCRPEEATGISHHPPPMESPGAN